MMNFTNDKLWFGCEGEFGDGDGTEEGYENCLWESGYEEEEEKDEDNDEY